MFAANKESGNPPGLLKALCPLVLLPRDKASISPHPTIHYIPQKVKIKIRTAGQLSATSLVIQQRFDRMLS